MFEIMSAKEPIMLRINPMLVILTRPNLSDNPPATTIKTPVSNEVKLTAILTTLMSIL